MVQPALHRLVCLIAAPTQVLSGDDGTIDGRSAGGGAHGLFRADVRAVSEATLTVGGSVPELVAREESTASARFVTLLREPVAQLADTVDPLVRLERRRDVDPGGWTERVSITSGLPHAVTLDVELRLASDLAPMEMIKDGRPTALRPPTGTDGERPGWRDDQTEVAVIAAGAGIRADGDHLVLAWRVEVPGGEAAMIDWRVDVTDPTAVVAAAPVAETATGRSWSSTLLDRTRIGSADDPALSHWVQRSFDDLAGLRMSLTESPEDAFFAAGAPWYFTLFGRDSLWAARLLLPVDPRPAIGTLRVLARLIGRTDDPETGEQPGKVLHELRRGTYGFGTLSLPPRYYGTVDATSLWCCLLVELWRSKAAPEVVVELLPTLEAALAWQRDAAGDGFLSYLDPTGHGLSNQGWKDSGDSIRFADGTIAEGPVELCEVQGYAHAAALGAADLLDAHDRPGGDGHRTWARRLAERFDERFWVERDGRRFPALALDGAGRPVDSLTSNIGHLLGTGIIDKAGEAAVVDLMTGPDMDSGLGLRTMSASDGGYQPLSYHCGSVWPHDTAIVIDGMVRSGHAHRATGLAAGLIRAAARFDGRLPELWSGEGAPGVPYPAACRPQAWSAASVVPVLRAVGLLG